MKEELKQELGEKLKKKIEEIEEKIKEIEERIEKIKADLDDAYNSIYKFKDETKSELKRIYKKINE
jgi:archaellum component FlaC